MSWMASVIGLVAAILSLALSGTASLAMAMFGMAVIALGAIGMGIEEAIRKSRL